MKKYLFVLFYCLSSLLIKVNGQENLSDIVSALEKRYENLQQKQDLAVSNIKFLQENNVLQKKRILKLQSDYSEQQAVINSLKVEVDKLLEQQSDDRTTFNGQIEKTNANVQANETSLYQRTLWGGLIVLGIILVLVAALYLLLQRIKKGRSSIDEVKKVQDTLQAAQTKLQEESVKLDNKLLEVIEKQVAATPVLSALGSAKTDHSLALKVADEIVRIEMNLSRMDASVKGYKQLAKAVQRIKDNFLANGYEIVDMLGKSYVTGTKAAVTFITDENLNAGQQIITKIIKPQINYLQQMIQAAQIEVSQAE